MATLTLKPILNTDDYSRGMDITPYKVKRCTIRWDQIDDSATVPIPMPNGAVIIETGLVVTEAYSAGTADLVYGDLYTPLGATLPLNAAGVETWKQSVPEAHGERVYLKLSGAAGSTAGKVTALLMFIDED